MTKQHEQSGTERIDALLREVDRFRRNVHQMKAKLAMAKRRMADAETETDGLMCAIKLIDDTGLTADRWASLMSSASTVRMRMRDLRAIRMEM